jgi:hypothetical protein
LQGLQGQKKKKSILKLFNSNFFFDLAILQGQKKNYEVAKLSRQKCQKFSDLAILQGQKM